MLDNQNYLHDHDPDNALGFAQKQTEYFNAVFDTVYTPRNPVQNIVWAGMGGSALPAVILTSWPRLRVPLEISRGYDIPPYVGENTLFIASSYSGKTEETLEALTKAEAAGADIVVIAAGGQLAELARNKTYPLFSLPAGIQPRMATFYFVVAFCAIIKDLDVAIEDISELSQIGGWLSQEVAQWNADVPTSNNLAKQIALKLAGKTPIIYAGPKLFPAANKWKTDCNENAKNTAWANYYPELNHNEFIGWSSHPIEKPFAVVELRSALEHPRVQRRFELTERLLSGLRPAPIVVTPHGDTLLQQLTYSFALGDFCTIYLAILNGVDPTPVALVEKLKVALN